ncbi:MAG: hypothetical protein M1160_01980 [Candidatus Marsarchaeota archaeon]|jgi:phosphatidylglycerophosphate synthase|nr:hypothetical protein [Candidatus Marsarchaeota archaeon]MCL5111631.1 hypothetical protein [Candidatus Marsarchaeota archaeon]
MNRADAVTVFRTLLVFLIVYLVLIRFAIAATLILIALMFLLDAIDGFAAISEKSHGRVSLPDYIRSALGNPSAKLKVAKFKALPGSPYGPRLDVAGDRVIEYVFWILFTYLGIIPLAILLAVVVRHSFVDALMGSKGTSSKMRSGFARAVYSSNLSRGGINVVKGVAFGYLSLIYVTGLVFGWYLVLGYAIVAVMFVYIMLRGAAEIYESVRR